MGLSSLLFLILPTLNPKYLLAGWEQGNQEHESRGIWKAHGAKWGRVLRSGDNWLGSTQLPKPTPGSDEALGLLVPSGPLQLLTCSLHTYTESLLGHCRLPPHLLGRCLSWQVLGQANPDVWKKGHTSFLRTGFGGSLLWHSIKRQHLREQSTFSPLATTL